MAEKNIAVFSDGTGNRGGETRCTNVWRLYNRDYQDLIVYNLLILMLYNNADQRLCRPQ